MSQRIAAAVSMLCLCAVSCTPQGEEQRAYKAVLDEALVACPMARDFASMYAGKIAWLAHFRPGSGRTGLHLKAAFHDRYILSMHVPLTLDQNRDCVASCGTPEILLVR